MKGIHLVVVCFVVIGFGAVNMGTITHARGSPSTTSVSSVFTMTGRSLSADVEIDVSVSPETSIEFAKKAAAYWIQRIGPHIESLMQHVIPWRGEDDDTQARLHEVGLQSGGDFCYYLFSIIPRPPKGPEVKFDNNTRVCRQSPIDNFWLRAYVIAGIIETVLAAQVGDFPVPFQFYLDVGDGSRTLPHSGEELGLPLLSWAFSPGQDYMLPFPDYYSLVGYFGPEAISRLPESHHEWAKGMQSVYGKDAIPLVPWEGKRNQGVYRGSCFVTFDPDSLNGAVALRPQMCQVNALAPHLDMAMTPPTIENPKDPFWSQLESNAFAACAHCAMGKRGGSKTRREMMEYKYQIAVDGYGTSCDSTHWKMLSNSAVIIVSPDHGNRPLWAHWYQPFLEPYRHFVPATVSEVGERIAWCREHDVEAREVARKARAFFRQSFSREGAGHFIYLILKYVSDLRSRQTLDAKDVSRNEDE